MMPDGTWYYYYKYDLFQPMCLLTELKPSLKNSSAWSSHEVSKGKSASLWAPVWVLSTTLFLSLSSAFLWPMFSVLEMSLGIFTTSSDQDPVWESQSPCQSTLSNSSKVSTLGKCPTGFYVKIQRKTPSNSLMDLNCTSERLAIVLFLIL